MTLVKQYLSSDMRTIKKTLTNIKYQADAELANEFGILYQQTKLRTHPGKFWEPTNHTAKVLNDVSYVSMKNWQLLYTKTITCYTKDPK